MSDGLHCIGFCLKHTQSECASIDRSIDRSGARCGFAFEVAAIATLPMTIVGLITPLLSGVLRCDGFCDCNACMVHNVDVPRRLKLNFEINA